MPSSESTPKQDIGTLAYFISGLITLIIVAIFMLILPWPIATFFSIFRWYVHYVIEVFRTVV